MINQEKMNSYLAEYKNQFPLNWNGEKYKWVAVAHFQKNWDIDAEDFAKMFFLATEKTGNLLASGPGFFPKKLVVDFLAQADESATREMFRKLYDESIDLLSRVVSFQTTTQELMLKHFPNENYDFDTHAISTFLWLRYPKQYYIYMFSRSQAASQELNPSLRPRADGKAESMLDGYRLNDEIRKVLKEDKDIPNILHNCLDNDYFYADPELVTATIDFVNFVYKCTRNRRNQDISAQSSEEETYNLDEPSMTNEDGSSVDQAAFSDDSETSNREYTSENFLEEVYMEQREYEQLKDLLTKKKNIILRGVPGVGKTFAAKRLAYSMMGVVDNSRIAMVQFHQNYSYDDFIEGYRPNENSFKLEPGVFLQFCKKANADPGRNYFFIIDEINRGNLSRIFGELLMLIENKHREETVSLAYSKKLFSVPNNLYIIGMMNTADRSLAMIDHALRRRFGVFTMTPAFDTPRFKQYLQSLESTKMIALIDEINKLNSDIKKSLGKGFMIGHSYFCDKNKETDPVTDSWLYSVVTYEIIPTLEEYWFDEEEKAELWGEKLQNAIRDQSSETPNNIES